MIAKDGERNGPLPTTRSDDDLPAAFM